MHQAEILKRVNEASETLSGFCIPVDKDIFFHQPADKWSIAQHVQHLAISTRSIKLAYTLPSFILRLISGKPNRPSRSYEELVSRYQSKLQKGGKAGGRYVPSVVSPSYGQVKLIDDFSTSMDRLASTISRNWKDDKLDRYLAPHPLLGRITLRELGYFTIYHTYHHLEIIKQRLSKPT